MKRRNFKCLLVITLICWGVQLEAQSNTKGLYVDTRAGFFIISDGAHGSLSATAGYRINERLGFGGGFFRGYEGNTILNGFGFNGLGVEARLNLGRFLIKGMVGQTTDVTGSIFSQCVTTYDSKGFKPFINGYVGYQFGYFTVGFSQIYSPNHRYTIWPEKTNETALADCLDTYTITERFINSTLCVGISFPRKKKKK